MTLTFARKGRGEQVRVVPIEESIPEPKPEPRWMRFTQSGGSSLAVYDRNSPVDMLAAKALFTQLARERVMLYAASDTDLARPQGGTRHELTREFDPHAAEYVMQRPYAGG